MRRAKLSILLVSTLLFTFITTGTAKSESHLCEGFLPDNDLQIPIGDRTVIGMKGNGGLTEQQYQELMDRFEMLFKDVVKQKGGNLQVNRLWTNNTVNASAERRGSTWIINMYGGLARHPDMTFEGEALVACHELGHHIGGAPKIDGVFGNNWATDEGGSDYFATLKCLRTFFAQDDNASIIAQTQIDPFARSQCMAQYGSAYEQNLCMRISMAAESVSYVFQALRKDSKRPMFNTPDTSQVSRTNHDHPETQCRMDTYFNGAICNKPVGDDVSETDYKAGSCVEGVDQVGWRPRCWFAPTSGGQNPNPGPGNPPGGGNCPLGDEALCKQICEMQPDLPFCKE